CMQTLAFPLTF
nr:immunoglobulin light chain junction region [Macaca mulatta]